MDLHFVKMHGLGNDFIVIDDRADELQLSPEAVEWFCDRNFGIGADGIIIAREPTDESADLAWEFFNSDGSISEMCGNGIRCIARFAVTHGIVPADQETVRVETSVGVLPIDILRGEDGSFQAATVDMGRPTLDAAEIPTDLRSSTPAGPVFDCMLPTELGEFSVTCVSMGNPHCVIFVDDVETAPVCEVGPVIETHPMFPNRTNVEFAEVTGQDSIRLRVWERGVGETLACGTGACATVVASILTKRTRRRVLVDLPGGELDIEWSEDGHVFMTGPAEEVFSGTLTIQEDDEAE